MLRPDERQHLLELLRPPAGSKLDIAVGTTFSLDLLSALMLPLSFAFFDWEHEDGELVADPLALLEALRRYTEFPLRLNAGDKLTFLSDGVIEAQNRRGELFGFDRTAAISTHSAEQIAATAQRFGQEDDITVLTPSYAGTEVALA